jgi:hypothetical protein
MKKLLALSMLIFSVAPACADDNSVQVHPWEAYQVEVAKKSRDDIEGTIWYLNHQYYDPQLENGICVKNCDGVVDVTKRAATPHRFYGNGMVDMLAGAKCITIPASGCDANWTAKRHAKKVAYHQPVCRR